jgi:hypothetical protein
MGLASQRHGGAPAAAAADVPARPIIIDFCMDREQHFDKHIYEQRTKLGHRTTKNNGQRTLFGHKHKLI